MLLRKKDIAVLENMLANLNNKERARTKEVKGALSIANNQVTRLTALNELKDEIIKTQEEEIKKIDKLLKSKEKEQKKLHEYLDMVAEILKANEDKAILK